MFAQTAGQNVSDLINKIAMKLVSTINELKDINDTDYVQATEKIAALSTQVCGDIKSTQLTFSSIEPHMVKMSNVLRTSHSVLHSALFQLNQLKQSAKLNQLNDADKDKLNSACAIYNEALDLDESFRPKYVILDQHLCEAREALQKISGYRLS